MQEQFSVEVGEVYLSQSWYNWNSRIRRFLVYLSALSPPRFLKQSCQSLTLCSQSLVALPVKAEIVPKWNQSEIKIKSGCGRIFLSKRQELLGSKEG